MLAKLHEAAEAELHEQASYVESQRRGFGERFYRAFEQARDHVLAHALAGRPGPLGTRSAGLPGFSHDIVYVLRGDLLLIVAIAHHRRRPGYWSNRL
jgi:plasmid stabilization system protein ParE